MSSPFEVTLTGDGNFLMASGYVVPIRSGQAPILVSEGFTGTLSPPPVRVDGLRTVVPGFSIFTGGSGRNLRVDAGAVPDVPSGYFKAFNAVTHAALAFPSAFTKLNADGSVEINDGTAAIGTLPAGSLTTTVAPTGNFTVPATSYGRTTYNGGAAFNLTVFTETDPATFVFPSVEVYFNAGTALTDIFTASDADNYSATTDPTWTLTVNSDGSADIRDATDKVASRAAGIGNPHDASGPFLSTTYGETTYNAGEPFAANVCPIVTNPVAGWIWVEITESAPGVVASVSRPLWGVTMPSPTSTVFPVALAYSDGTGTVQQFQDGPIYWSGGGGGGSGAAFEEITSADYDAAATAGTLDPDTYYDITDYEAD